MPAPATTLLPHAPEVIRDLAAALAPGRIVVLLATSGSIAEFAAKEIRASFPEGRRPSVRAPELGLDRVASAADSDGGCIVVSTGTPLYSSVRRISDSPLIPPGCVTAIAAYGAYIPMLCPHCAQPATQVSPAGQRLAEAWGIAPKDTLVRGRAANCICANRGNGYLLERPACFRSCVFDDRLMSQPLASAVLEIDGLFAATSAHARLAAAARRTAGLRLWSALDDLRTRVEKRMMSLDDAAEAAEYDGKPQCRLSTEHGQARPGYLLQAIR